MQCNNEKGFTLVEAMIAVFLLTIMMLASVMGLVNIKDRGMENVIRQEAVKLGQELVNDVRSILYTGVATTPSEDIIRQVGGFDIIFRVKQDVVVVLVNTSKSVTYTITWASASTSNNKTYIARTLVANR